MNLFISDLDKTLLNDNAQLSAYAKDELNQMIQDGLHFTIATARGHLSATEILKGLKIQLPIVVANGSFITDYQTGKVLMLQQIQDNINEEILRILTSLEIYPYVSSFDGEKSIISHSLINNKGSNWYLEELLRTKDPRRTELKNIFHSLENKIISLTAIHNESKIKEAYQILSSRFENELEIHYYENPYHKGWFWMSIHDINATKKSGIEKLNKMMGYSPEKLTVFGDNVNDIPMFELSKHKIAVANAIDELKNMATHICNSNEEHGVVEYIKKQYY